MIDWITASVATNKLKNGLQLLKMARTNVYDRYGRKNFESRNMKGLTLVDSMADRKNLIVVSLDS